MSGGRGGRVRGPGPPATGSGRVRAVADALASIAGHPDMTARPDYEPFTAAIDHADGRVIVTAARPQRVSALLNAITDEGGFAPGAVFERLLEAEHAAQAASGRRRTRADVRRYLARSVNPYLHLGRRPEEIRNAFDAVVVVRQG